MLNEIYNRKILQLAANIGLTERLDGPHGTAIKHSRLCGSRVHVDVKVVNGRISAYGQQVKACALGQAAAAIMAKNVIGASRAELQTVRDQVYAMLKENADPPEGKWHEVAALEPVREIKARHASVMLVFDAVLAALDDCNRKGQEKN